MVQDTTGLWAGPPLPANQDAGSVGPGELPQTRFVPRPEDQPWHVPASGAGSRTSEHATGHVLDTVA